ncbi:PREDICTED: follicle cell protein 3C-1 isoform X2 [Nicrophorus vespilloides]|nr:PREDICTED: follicle cell protein 3C-1 isoform X2 [Nicrophorus vespilloides]
MSKLFLVCAMLLLVVAVNADKTKKEGKSKKEHSKPVPCTCGIFLSGQLKKGSKDSPKGDPVLTQELDTHFAHNSIGQRQCANKCLENMIKHLPKSADIICATVDRDVRKEKALLFTKNYDATWINSNMSAGRDFCCKDNVPYKCPLM